MKKSLIITILLLAPSIAFAMVTFGGHVTLLGNTHSASFPIDLPAGAYLFDGDSLTVGFNTVLPPSLRVQNLLDAAGLPYSEVTNYGVSGSTLQQMIDRAAANVDTHIGLYPGKKDIVVFWGGTNSIGTGVSLANVESQYTTYVQARKATGAKVVVLTIISAKYQTLPDMDTERLAFNDWLRANWSAIGADRLVDLASDSRYTDYSNLTYYDSGGIHLTVTGYSGVGDDIYAKLIPWQ